MVKQCEKAACELHSYVSTMKYMSSKCIPSFKAMSFLVSSPDQIFRMCPADSLKERSGHAKTRARLHMAVSNWVIVSVNCIISYQHHLPKNLQAICDDA